MPDQIEMPDEPTALYHIYGDGQILLYIGISNDFGTRWNQHAKVQPWWEDKCDMTVRWYNSRDEAAAAETAAIRAEKPKYNIAKTGTVALRKPRQKQKPLARRAISPVVREDEDGRWIRVPPGVGVDFVYPMPDGTLGADAGFIYAQSVTVLRHGE